MTNIRQQINVRLDPEMTARIDEKRIELSRSLGMIPTRSEVLRMALEAFLTISDPEEKRAR